MLLNLMTTVVVCKQLFQVIVRVLRAEDGEDVSHSCSRVLKEMKHFFECLLLHDH